MSRGKYDYSVVDGETKAKLKDSYKELNLINRYNYLLKQSGIPKDYWDIEFEHYEGKLSIGNLNKAKIYCQKSEDPKFENVSLYLWGKNNGTQKSAVMNNIGKAFIKKGYKVLHIHAGDLIDMLMKNQGFSVDEVTRDKIEQYKNCDLLLIDEIFDTDKSLLWANSSNKGMIISEWDRFLRYRTSTDRRTVTTSNVDMSDIIKYFGQSLYELMDRNFERLQFLDSVKKVRQGRLKDLWKE